MVQHDFFTAATITVSYMERYKPVRQRFKKKKSVPTLSTRLQMHPLKAGKFQLLQYDDISYTQALYTLTDCVTCVLHAFLTGHSIGSTLLVLGWSSQLS